MISINAFMRSGAGVKFWINSCCGLQASCLPAPRQPGGKQINRISSKLRKATGQPLGLEVTRKGAAWRPGRVRLAHCER